jgi:beta-galactosidase
MNPEMHTHTRERLLMDAGWKFHYYQAWWSNRTVLHLFPHWNWPGRDGDVIAVWVHSNCDEVELFLNGTTLGRQTVQKARHLEWRVPYHPGALTARGWKQGQHVATACVETSGPPAGIRLTSESTMAGGMG